LIPVSWSREPKNGVHSDPEYVVGIETTGMPVSEDAAFAVSIALPPPRATSASAPFACAAASAPSTPLASACGPTPA
jgi:hypothetical protein